MNKKVLCLYIALILILSSCSVSKTDKNNIQNTDAVNEAWSSTGGAFKQSSLNIPGNYLSVFAHGSDFYEATVFFGDKKSDTYQIIENGKKTLYSLENGHIDCASASDSGIWVVETEITKDNATERLRLLSYSGDVLQTINLNDIEEFDSPIYAIRCTSQRIYLKSSNQIAVVNCSGELIANHKLSDPRTNLIIGNDGSAYLAYYTDEKIEVNLIDDNEIKPILSLAGVKGKLYFGNEEYCFVLSNHEGLYGLQLDGSMSPILIWSDCNIAFSNIVGIVPLSENKYICLDIMGPYMLSPADPSDMHKKIQLIMAAVGDANNIKPTVANFNISNNDYYVDIIDYSEGGSYDANTAITRLNTDIISGKYPDLILFSDLSPVAYSKKGYLLDLLKLMDKDPDLGRDDIAILDQLMSNGGVYYLSGTFSIATQLGLYSDFGDATGWTLDKYLDIERNSPPEVETIHNITKPYFFRMLCSRYLNNAINWDTGKCDFDNEQFISILEASNQIKENPEPTNLSELNTTPGPIRLVEKSLVTSAVGFRSVSEWANKEKMAGCRLSCIGWPTADGSCGSDIYLSAPVGICSQSEHPEACWEFLKFLLTGFDPTSSFSLPVYMPYLQKQIEQAKLEAPTDGVKITDEDVKRFFDLLSKIDNVTIYDETVLDIIDEEASAFFAGDKTAKETAEIIQSRVQLYVSEQFS